jgi:hypothetical protein
VRPLSMAKRVPRHSVFTRWPGGVGSPTGTCLDQARCFPLRACGARPSAGGPSEGEKALRGQTRGWREKRFFSEGRTLCVRIARLHVDRDISFPPHPLTMAR